MLAIGNTKLSKQSVGLKYFNLGAERDGHIIIHILVSVVKVENTKGTHIYIIHLSR